MTSTRLDGKRVLLTQSQDFMGPALADVFRDSGAEVIADPRALDQDPALPAAIVRAAGRVDVLLVHLALPAPATPAGEITDAEWRTVFAHLVDPMPRLVAAVLPQMIERRSGRILVMGSAAALRGQKRTGSYSAARGAQLAYVQAVALELAPHGIQINAIAQNFVDNPTYYGAEVQANPRFQERLRREVPLGRLVSAEEDARFAAYLCSDAAACFVGQVFPLSGGWVNREARPPRAGPAPVTGAAGPLGRRPARRGRRRRAGSTRRARAARRAARPARIGHQFHERARLQVGVHQRQRLKAPAHAGQRRGDEGLRRGQGVPGQIDVTVAEAPHPARPAGRPSR